MLKSSCCPPTHVEVCTPFLTVFSVVPLRRAVTINYHHTTGSRAPSLDDDEEEEDRLHAMISMICSRNLTDPNVMKGFYHLNTPPHRPSLPPLAITPSQVLPPLFPPTPPALCACVLMCCCPTEPNSVQQAGCPRRRQDGGF